MSLILTLAMLITALPFGVFAEEEQQVQTPAAVVETVEVPAAEQPKAEEPEAPAQPAAQEPEAPAQPAAQEPEAPVQPAAQEPEAPQQPAEQEPEVPAQPAAQEPEAPQQPAEQEPEAPVQPAVKEQLTEQPDEAAIAEKPQVVKYTVSFSDGFGWSFTMEVEEGKEISKLPPAPKAEGYEFVRFYREVKQLAEDGVTEEIVRKTVSASTVVTESFKVKVEYKKIEEPAEPAEPA